MKVLVDLSSIARPSLYSGKDTEGGVWEVDENGKATLINSAEFGLAKLCQQVANFVTQFDISLHDVIFVLDGKFGTRKRKSLYPNYKAGRSKSATYFEQYNLMLSEFQKIMLDLGCHFVVADNYEADDVIACLSSYFCQKEQVVVWTGDYDLLSLVNENTDVYCRGELNPKPFGDFDYRFIPLYKATVGDNSDNIKGAKGFGEAAFNQVYQKYGENGLKWIEHYAKSRGQLGNLLSFVEECPPLKKLIDYSSDVELSMKLVLPQKIDVEDLSWSHGMNKATPCSMPCFSQFEQKVLGVTAKNFAQTFEEIKTLIKGNELVALDIETSTPMESDDWLFDIKGKEGGVDVFASELTGLSITLGRHFHRTFYFSINHKDTDNISLTELETVLKFLDKNCRFIIQNCNFELPVLHNTFGWFLRDVDDTKIMSSYVNENLPNGLKGNSKHWLNYEQTDYESTVMSADGRLRKMDELTLNEVLAYGADDTICTAALYNLFAIRMGLENTFDIYRQVEIGAIYWVAQAFLDGVKIDQVALSKMIARDKQDKSEFENTLNNYLIEKGWEGSVFKPATEDTRYTPQWVKYAYEVVEGKKLETAVRKFEKLLIAIKEQGADELASVLEFADLKTLNQYVQRYFTGKPEFNVGSPMQVQRLMYEVMGLPIRLRNKPTDVMRGKGITEGSAQTDDVAIHSAMHYDLPDLEDPRREVLESLLKIKMYNTREGLYYKTYPKLPHWKDGKIRTSLNQCATVTRRYTSSSPNLQQLSKGAGDFRKVFIPHHKQAMIVSLDFSAQELRLTAHASQDPNMLACYIGENPRDMHSITGSSIAKMAYEDFKAIIDDETHPQHKQMKSYRAIGKTVNFAELYGASALTMSQNLMCSENEAQNYIDAKAKAFPQVAKWKEKSEVNAVRSGYSSTLLGARRHIPDLRSSETWLQQRASRQAVNYIIQGSGAEMTKLAMSRIWNNKLRERYDIRFFAPIHDELVFSIAIKDMPSAICEIHEAMTAQYADMVVPIESSISFGWNFGEQHEVGDVGKPTPELIKQHLKDYFDVEL